MKKIETLGLRTIPKIGPGDNLAEIIVKSVDGEIGGRSCSETPSL